MNQEYFSLNGDECSYADVGITFDIPGAPSLRRLDVTAVKWSGKVDVGESRGTGRYVLGTTAGQVSFEGSCSITRGGLIAIENALRDAAQAAGLVVSGVAQISRVRFGLHIIHTPLGWTSFPEKLLEKCRVLSITDDMKAGNEADTIELDLHPQRVLSRSDAGADWVTL